MVKPTIFFLFLLLPLLFSVPSSSTLVDNHLRLRRLLHQPLFPLESNPPSASPALPPLSHQKQPKLPFSTTPSTPSTPNSFFPNTFSSPPPPPTPPPPPPGYLATFPANISSLLLPHAPSTSHSLRRHIVAIAVSVSLLSAALIATLAAFLYFYRRHGSHLDFDPTDKTPRIDSVRLFPPDTTTSDSAAVKPHSSSSTSTEFLYLSKSSLRNSVAKKFDDILKFTVCDCCNYL